MFGACEGKRVCLCDWREVSGRVIEGEVTDLEYARPSLSYGRWSFTAECGLLVVVSETPLWILASQVNSCVCLGKLISLSLSFFI